MSKPKKTKICLNNRFFEVIPYEPDQKTYLSAGGNLVEIYRHEPECYIGAILVGKKWSEVSFGENGTRPMIVLTKALIEIPRDKNYFPESITFKEEEIIQFDNFMEDGAQIKVYRGNQKFADGTRVIHYYREGINTVTFDSHTDHLQKSPIPANVMAIVFHDDGRVGTHFSDRETTLTEICTHFGTQSLGWILAPREFQELTKGRSWLRKKGK